MLQQIEKLIENHKNLILRPNAPTDEWNGIFTRYKYPVFTDKHIPPDWIFDYERGQLELGINSAFNSGAIYLEGWYSLVIRVEGYDRKSFFVLARSKSPTEGFRPIKILEFPGVQGETDIYDMRLTKHSDGYFYGIFCSESKDETKPDDTTAARADCGIVRTKDLFDTWERLPNLSYSNNAPTQQRNVLLFPEKIQGRYAFYTRPQKGFLDGRGICFVSCDDITNAVIDENAEIPVDSCVYHQVAETKNGAGAVPIKTKEGWVNIVHGVRNTAAGLRYTLYTFITDLEEPWKVLKKPSGYFLSPQGDERIGDVSNVVFTNGAAVNEKGEIAIYYGSSDTRLNVVTTTIDQMLRYIFNTPKDSNCSADSVLQRLTLIEKNKNYLEQNN